MTRNQRIQKSIAEHRRLYNICVDACHDGEAEWHESVIDALVSQLTKQGKVSHRA